MYRIKELKSKGLCRGKKGADPFTADEIQMLNFKKDFWTLTFLNFTTNLIIDSHYIVEQLNILWSEIKKEHVQLRWGDVKLKKTNKGKTNTLSTQNELQKQRRAWQGMFRPLGANC